MNIIVSFLTEIALTFLICSAIIVSFITLVTPKPNKTETK